MINFFSYYRIVAAYLILLIHQQFWVVPGPLGRLTSSAVPLFAAMAGFLFKRAVVDDFDFKAILAKKARRILLPYSLWAIVYWIANCIVLDGIVRHETIAFPGLRSWLLGGTACHLWFLPCLFIAFVLVAGGAWLAKKLSINMAWFIGVLLVISAATQLIPDATSATLAGFAKIYLGRLLFFFALGFLISFLEVPHTICIQVIELGLIIIGLGNILCQWIDGLVWSPLVLVMGLLLVAQGKPNIKLPQWVGKLADASMGIYLVHVLFTSGMNFVLQKAGVMPLPGLIGLLLSIFLFGVTYLIVRILPKKVF